MENRIERLYKKYQESGETILDIEIAESMLESAKANTNLKGTSLYYKHITDCEEALVHQILLNLV